MGRAHRRPPAAALTPDPGPELARALDEAVRERRCVFVAGLPGTGKSVIVDLLVGIAARRGRAAHTIEWDVARLAFDTPAILARYPEVDGVTHPAIRVAAGEWARAAVRRWHEGHRDPSAILIGETPLIGERFMSLARPRADAIEPHLAGPATVFVVPVPSREVRAAMEAARARDVAAPGHARDTASAPPHLVRSHWDETLRAAEALGVARVDDRGPYDPEVYAATYRAVLRHRGVAVLRVADVAPPRAPTRGDRRDVSALVPSVDEVAAAMMGVAARSAADLELAADGWYRTETQPVPARPL